LSKGSFSFSILFSSLISSGAIIDFPFILLLSVLLLFGSSLFKISDKVLLLI